MATMKQASEFCIRELPMAIPLNLPIEIPLNFADQFHSSEQHDQLVILEHSGLTR